MLEQKEIWIILKYFLARHRNLSVHLYCHFLTGEKIPGLQVYYLIQKANAFIVFGVILYICTYEQILIFSIT